MPTQGTLSIGWKSDERAEFVLLLYLLTLRHSRDWQLSAHSAAGAYEALGMFYAGRTHFLIVSGKTGWRGNPNQMFYSDSISGSWHGPHPIAPDSSNTYSSRNTSELVIKGTKKANYIYMDDLWNSTGGPSSNYLWLPTSVNKVGAPCSKLLKFAC